MMGIRQTQQSHKTLCAAIVCVYLVAWKRETLTFNSEQEFSAIYVNCTKSLYPVSYNL